MMGEGMTGGGGFCIGRNIEFGDGAGVPVDDRPAAISGFLGDTYRGHWILADDYHSIHYRSFLLIYIRNPLYHA